MKKDPFTDTASYRPKNTAHFLRVCFTYCEIRVIKLLKGEVEEETL